MQKPCNILTEAERLKLVNKRLGLTLVEALIVIGILVVLAAFLIPGTRRGRVDARRIQCMNNLKNIAVAIQSYADYYESLPPAYTVDESGRRLHSWRTLILPFLDEASLYETIDLTKPWDDPANANAFKKNLPIFQCPSRELPSNYTTYLGLVGEESFFHPNRPRQLSEITDGTSNTAAVIEVAAEDATHWMSPHDVVGEYLIDLKEKKTLSHNTIINVMSADGTIQAINVETSTERLRSLTTIAGDDDDFDVDSW